MSNLVPAIISLDKGLNLQTAKLVAPPGSVLDTLNYEQIDFQGQKRIEGYARYDGSFLPAINEYARILLTSKTIPLLVGDILLTDTGNVYAIVVGLDSPISGHTVIYVVEINDNITPKLNDRLVGKRLTGEHSLSGDNALVVYSSQHGSDTGITVDEHYANLLTFTGALKARVGKVPGTIIGLHWFLDRLYAVADVTRIQVTLEVDMDDQPIEIYPGDILHNHVTGETTKVLDAYNLNADYSRDLFLDTLNPEDWYVNGLELYRVEGMSETLVATVNETVAAEVPRIASLFVARSEQQVLDEDTESSFFTFGWKFVDQGWEVLYTAGNSAFGSLPSLNQNITGLGTEGPTSVAGSSGEPLLLTQKAAITGKITQINGWKSSNSPSLYQLEASDVAEIDANFTYADAFISWDGLTTEVSAPGLTDSNLIEYPANNTIILG